MGLKSKIKRLFAHKEYMPIYHPVTTDKEFDGKVALIGGAQAVLVLQ